MTGVREHIGKVWVLHLMVAYAVFGAVAPAMAANCKSYSTCREAVIAWCQGRHPGADRDKDGIPCENVCSSRAAVEAIMAEIGCDR